MNILKVAQEKFTWSGRKIPHIGRYGGHRWHGFWLRVLDAQATFPLSTELVITSDRQGHSPLSPGVDGLRSHVNQPESGLSKI